MKTPLKSGMVYRNHKFAKTDMLLGGRTIYAVGDDLQADDAKMVDMAGAYVVPGFIDVHTHGAVGVNVDDTSAEDFERICRFQATQRTTNWQGSILANTRGQTLACIEEYNTWKAMEHEGADLMGIRLEGPFLCADYKGVMPEHLLQKPNMELLKEYQDVAHGDIRYITVSPEVKGIPEFIPEMKKLGMVVAIGHSGADCDTARKAIANGAMASTHTGNTMKLLHQHFPAVQGAMLEDGNLYCEIICGGRRLHPGTVHLIIRTKGLDQVVAITDSIMAAGLPDGDYRLGVNDVMVVDGGARLKSDGARAGSTLTIGRTLLNLLEFTGKPSERILPLLTENPAKLIGVYDRVDSIEEGKEADVVVLDKDCQMVRTYSRGKEAYRK